MDLVDENMRYIILKIILELNNNIITYELRHVKFRIR